MVIWGLWNVPFPFTSVFFKVFVCFYLMWLLRKAGMQFKIRINQNAELVKACVKKWKMLQGQNINLEVCLFVLNKLAHFEFVANNKLQKSHIVSYSNILVKSFQILAWYKISASQRMRKMRRNVLLWLTFCFILSQMGDCGPLLPGLLYINTKKSCIVLIHAEKVLLNIFEPLIWDWFLDFWSAI